MLRDLIAKDPRNPQPLVEYIQALLRNNHADQAGTWLDKLTALRPNSPQIDQLQIAILTATGKTREAADILKALAARDPNLLPTAAARLESLGQVQEAEQLYRQYVARFQPLNAEAVFALTEFLGRQKRTREALELCAPAWQQVSITPAVVATACLDALTVNPAPDQAQRIDAWLQDALRKHPNDLKLQLNQAILRTLQGRFPEAEALYRQALFVEPNNIIALNNLAWLLALKLNKTSEAMSLIDQAIQIAGPQPSLVDTRAVILFTQGKAAEAIRELEPLTATNPAPTISFHLAQAQFAAKQPDAARATFQNAVKLGLKPEILDPLERSAYEASAQTLKSDQK